MSAGDVSWVLMMEWLHNHAHALDTGLHARLIELQEGKEGNWLTYNEEQQIRCINWLLGGIEK